MLIAINSNYRTSIYIKKNCQLHCQPGHIQTSPCLTNPYDVMGNPHDPPRDFCAHTDHPPHRLNRNDPTSRKVDPRSSSTLPVTSAAWLPTNAP